MVYILITDCFIRKAFDVISIIKKNFPQYNLIITTSKLDSFKKIKILSIYGDCKVATLNTLDYIPFEKELLAISNNFKNDKILYVPLEEVVTDYFINFINKNGNLNFISLTPKYDIFNLFRNKLLLNKFCLKNGFYSPKIYNIDDLSDINIYPIILKPVNGSGSEGIIYLYEKSELTKDIYIILESKPYVIQELLPNGRDVLGVFYLFEQGKCINAYSHRRIRTMPEKGGVTVFSELNFNDTLLNQGKELLKFVEWNGVIMMEYLYDSEVKQYKLIEANPRLWGSIMLSEYCGANILSNYIRLCLSMPAETREITENSKIRWLFPMDIFLYLKNGFKINNFWDFTDTCIINWSYANKVSAVIFNIYAVLSISNFKKILKKL